METDKSLILAPAETAERLPNFLVTKNNYELHLSTGAL
jgi:hypothetical protein